MLALIDLPPRKRFRLTLRAILLVVGGVTAYLASVFLQLNNFLVASLIAFITLLATFGEFVFADIITESIYPSRTENLLRKLEQNFRDTEAKIEASIKQAIESLQACDKSQISGNFHLVAELYATSGDGLEVVLVQVTDYIGDYGGKKWRFTSSTKGLIGRCLRTTTPEWVNFRTQDEYGHFMVRDFGFSADEITKHTEKARSYWAHPVYSRKKVVGVIFLFSTEVQTFPLAVDIASLNSTANEIAAYLEGAHIV